MRQMEVTRLIRRVAAVCLLLLPVQLLADLDRANQANRAGDRETAFREYLAAARTGDPRAFGRLAGLYLYGAGTEKDYTEAYIWFGLAQETGDKYAAKFKETAASAMSLPEIEKAEEALDLRRVQLGIGGE